MNKELRIRAFRATDDYETSKRFIDGHRKVLENHGISKVSSSNNDWAYNPAVFVVVVETIDGEKLYGGARVHAADGKTLLPIEEATGSMDPKVNEYINFYAQHGTGEICGLWNSKEVAGLGIGSLFPCRASIVISEQIGLSSVFGLCSPATVRFNQWMGSKVFTEVGNNGTFYYPKLDLLATALIHDDIKTLSNAMPRERDKMMFLRNNLVCNIKERSPFKNYEVQVHYDLVVKSANATEFLLNKKSVDLNDFHT